MKSSNIAPLKSEWKQVLKINDGVSSSKCQFIHISMFIYTHFVRLQFFRRNVVDGNIKMRFTLAKLLDWAPIICILSYGYKHWQIISYSFYTFSKCFNKINASIASTCTHIPFNNVEIITIVSLVNYMFTWLYKHFKHGIQYFWELLLLLHRESTV